MSNSSPGFVKRHMLPLVIIFAGLALALAKPVYYKLSPAELDMQISKAPVVMPAAYKVMANPDALNGKYTLFKMVLKNTSGNVAKNVEVSFEMPGFVEKTTIQKFSSLLPGQTVVVNCYPKFQDKIAEKMTSSTENVNVFVKGTNIKEMEESFSIPVKGRNEMVYTFIPADEIQTQEEQVDNRDLFGCFITPEDPIIKYYTGKIQQKILKGDLTNEMSESEGVRFMKGIHEALRLSGSVYSGTAGVPMTGEVKSTVQNVRLPREVVTARNGLCIELALLHASIMQGAGMKAVVYLIPGHAYPGFVMNGNHYAFEATAIGGENIRGGVKGADEAFNTGMQELKTFYEAAQRGDPRYQILYIDDLITRGAAPMELKDDNYLRSKIDEIAQTFDGGSVSQNAGSGGISGNGSGTEVSPAPNPDPGGGGNGGGGNVPAGYKSHSGNISFAYPGSWRRMQNINDMMVAHYGNSAGTMDVQVYEIAGASSSTQALNQLVRYVQSTGANCVYQVVGQQNGFTVVRGETSAGGNGLNWYGAFKMVNGGSTGITIGMRYGTNGTSVAQNILSTVQ